MNLDLSFYFAVFLRRIHYFIVIFALVSAAAIAAAFLLPAVYTANSLMIVESPQIPGQLAAPNVQMAALERLQKLESALMTRTNLLDIAQRLRVFEEIDKMSPDGIVQSMRDNTRIVKNAGRGQATLMSVQFEAETGPTAAAVVNEYVTVLLQFDAEQRQSSAEGTLEFFNQEVKRLSSELDVISSKILDFQNKNSDALPNTLNFRLGQQKLLQDRLATIERDIAALKDQKARMIAIFESTGQVNPTAPAANQTPEARQLDQLRTQLNGMLAVFTPENPKVKMLQLQIQQLEEVVRAQLPADSAADPAASMLDVQLADLDTRIALLEEERVRVLEQLDELQDSISRTPANQVALDALNRDYSNIQQQYNTAVARLSQAAAGEQIEVRSKGERLSLVDAATVPERPSKPNRILIAGGGVFAGAFLGVAFIALLEFLNRSVRRPKDLISAFGITPIATIPYMRTPSEVMMRRTGFALMLLVAVAGIPAMIYAVHVYYQPLDIIVSKVAAKLGIQL
ncbi:hypothetical protein DEA8626_03148 [Defluviimonas aquaemixtae]|uniref:Tyrosine-protein kinase G-rich domain-containing protein n=1 Tax=Albidovulum aquaemixtae TaxID=1542388 RepID=A0A2R8BL42_9RHOB|nr:GNVR domain-containing protein [Defluviimonas aquaemixtae]SPH24099.1 hypothetical protein DEA8626_03148 [Defluviimonas aquaemixtae]